MADENINVNITGDARSFLKASAEAKKALESLSKSSIKPISLGLDTRAFQKELAALKPTVGVGLKADVAEFQRQLLASTFVARVKLQVDTTALNNLSTGISSAVSSSVSSAVSSAVSRGGIGIGGVALGTMLGQRMASMGPRQAAVSGVPGTRAGAARAAALESVIPLIPEPGTGAAKPPGEGLQFMQAGINPGNIRDAARAVGELGGVAGQAIGSVLDFGSALTGLSRGGLIGAVAVAGIASAFKKGHEHLKDVVDDERALIALQANFGTAAEKVKKQIDDLAGAQPFVTDDRLMQAAALLKTFEATEDQVQTLLPAITALGIVYGKDVVDVAGQLANGLKGDTGALKQFGIVLKGNATASERYAAVLDRAKTASKQLGMFTRNTGSAMDGASVSMAKVNKAADDFGAAWGYAFAGPSKAINTFLEKILDLGSAILTLFPVIGSFGRNAEAMERMAEAWKNLTQGRGTKLQIDIPEIDDKAAKDKAARDKAARDKAARDKAARDKAEKEAKDKAYLELVGGGRLSTGRGLVPVNVPPPATVPPPKKEAFDFLAEFRKRFSVKELYGMGGLEGLNKAFEETEAAAKKAGAALSGPGYQEARSIVAGGKISGLQKISATDRSQLELINDPMERLRSSIELFPTEMARAQDQLAMAITADQKQSALDNIANLQLENKRNTAEYGRMVVDKNTALLTGMANVFSDFIQAFGDQIGRTLAGGAAPLSAGTSIRGVAGIAAGGLGVAGSLMPAGATIAGLAAGPVLAAVGVAVTGVASILAGFFDQADENARAALEKQQEQIRIQNEQKKSLAILAVNSNDAKIKAGKALGTVSSGAAALAETLSPFSGAAAEQMGTALGASVGAWYRRRKKGGGYEMYQGMSRPIEGATLGKDQQALIDYFGKPENMGKLKEAATQLAGGSKLGAVLKNMNIPGLEGRNIGQFGTEEQMTQTGNMLLNLFATLDQFYKDQGKNELDRELQMIGSTPRNPIYVYDVTPADQRFTFQPREAFFRASARQAGTNVTPGTVVSGGR